MYDSDRFFSNEDYPRLYGSEPIPTPPPAPAPEPTLEVVSSCPRCGAPVYGPMTVTQACPVRVVFTCCCAARRRGRGD